jgi:hypothetical protein
MEEAESQLAQARDLARELQLEKDELRGQLDVLSAELSEARAVCEQLQEEKAMLEDRFRDSLAMQSQTDIMDQVRKQLQDMQDSRPEHAPPRPSAYHPALSLTVEPVPDPRLLQDHSHEAASLAELKEASDALQGQLSEEVQRRQALQGQLEDSLRQGAVLVQRLQLA